MTDHAQASTGLEIAVVGMSCRFPGANDVEAFWRNLAEGVESITFFTDGELAAAGVPRDVREHPDFVAAGAVVDGLELFDARFFGFNPREAEIIDPQQRIFLECAVEALEDAGCDPERFPGGIGVWGGVGVNSYVLFNILGNPELMRLVGRQQLDFANRVDTLTTRVAYKLDLRGPAITVQTTCSTSLVAVHLACQSLLGGECDLALAGGVAIDVGQRQGYLWREGGILSRDGHCRAFDARASGTISGNGCGLVALRRLDDAIAGGDRILAVIRGSSVNNDGSLKASYTAPGVDGQAKVVRAAQIIAGVEPDTISYIEAHGTGTSLGDPIEIAALTRAFRAATDRRGFCALGSVKTNIGHLDVAAGVAGLIKTVLALHRRQLPPSLHFESLHPAIDFAASPFYVNAALADWPAVNGAPRRAGVSSLGIGGTNVHAILEEPPPAVASSPSRPRQLLLLSAKSPAALETATRNLASHLRLHPDLPLADAAYTLQVGRRAYEHRRAVVVADAEDTATALAGTDPRRLLTGAHDGGNRSVVFLFPGQGSQYPGMGAEIYRLEPAFRDEVDRCAALLRPDLGLDLRELLLPAPGTEERAAGELRQTRLAQPALFTIEYALARLWMEWGLRPRAMMGHSVGEYVAACLSGVLSLEDALALVAARGRMMQALPPGAMLSVALSEPAVRPLLGEALSVAALNGPELTVVSGPQEEVEALAARLAEDGVAARRLHTSHAFHSAMMDPILDPFYERVSRVALAAPEIPFLANLTGIWITAGEATDPAYWTRHLRSTVRFADGLRELLAEPGRTFLEVGPGRTLSTFARLQKDVDGNPPLAVPSMRHPLDAGSELEVLLAALGRLWIAGSAVDWSGFYAGETRRKVRLPAYPFERERYWIEPRRSLLDASGPVALAAAEAEELREEPRAELHSRPGISVPFTAPRTELEQTVAGLWERLLGISGVGVHDDFFELGGHSLLATQLLSRLRDRFRVELPLKAIFDAATVAGLAAEVEARIAAGSTGEELPLVPVPRQERLALSFAQQRLWFLHRFEPESDAYNMPLAVRLSGGLRVEALERTLAEIVRRHEVLRTTFPEIDGEPVQAISPPGPFPVRRIDLGDLSAAEREARLRDLAAAEARQPFDLASDPLVRATLVRLEEREHFALLTLHHIVTDGWSMGIFVREICALYKAFVLGEPSPLPELPLQYADFSQWQRRYLQGEVLDRELAYWRRTIGVNPPVLELPTDRPRTRERSWGGSMRRFTLRPDLAEALQRFGQQRNSTLFMALLTAFKILLHRYSGQQTLLIGTPIANRNRSEIEDLIGFFVNTLVLRTELEGDPMVDGLLARVREVSLAAHAHQDVPFERLVEELQTERDLSRSPLFQAFFVLQNTPISAADLPDLTLTLLQEETRSAKFDLSLQMEEGSNGLLGVLEYTTDLFDGPTADRLVEHFRILLEGAVADPARRVSELPLLAPAEREQLLTEWSTGRAVEFPSAGVVEMFEERAARAPEALAVLSPAGRLTYGELDERAGRIAAELHALGVGAEAAVGLYAGRSPELVIGALAALKAGCSYVPLDPSYPEDRLAFMAAESGMRVLLTAAQARPGWIAGGVRTIQLTAEPAAATPGGAPPALPESTAYILYTSGSTGRPKGVQIPHAGLTNLVRWHLRTYGVGERDRATLVASPAFDASVWEMWPYLAAGASLHVPDEDTRLSPERLRSWLDAEGITCCFLPTALAEQLLDLLERGAAPPASLRALLTGGDRLQRTPARPLPFALVNHYGPTENSVVATWEEVGPPEGRPPSIGSPIDNVQAYVLGPRGEPVPAGVAGELFLGGIGLARGYLGRPDLTAERFVPDPFGPAGGRLYRTGDRVRFLADGRLEFLGRLDQQVKLRGFRVELGEIEVAIARHPRVREAVVLARQAPDGDRRLVAYVVPVAGEVPASELRELLQRVLPEYMVPQVFVSLAAMPLSPNGKVDRRALPEPDGAAGPQTREYVAPGNNTEARLAEIFAEVLKTDRVGIHDNFFEIGGHSLKATQVVSRVRRVLGVELQLRRLFQTPTVAGLAEALAPLLPQAREKERIDSVLARLSGLSEEEARALLAEKLRAKPPDWKEMAR